MDKIRELKEKLFKQLVEDSKDKVQDSINHWLYMLGVAFDFGFEEGYKEGYKDFTSADIVPTAVSIKSDNVE